MGAARFGRSARRRVLFLLAVAILAASMLVAVRRSSEARQLSRELGALERAEDVAESALASALVRADSLASRTRMIRAGAKIGLRPVTEAEFEWLSQRPTAHRLARAPSDAGDAIGGSRDTRTR